MKKIKKRLVFFLLLWYIDIVIKLLCNSNKIYPSNPSPLWSDLSL